MRPKKMIKLYQFSISHYCEKIRWALDFKKVEHQIISMVPGLHMNHTKKMGVKSSVPILSDNNKLISGSIEIIDYLDDNFPKNQLTPINSAAKKEVLEWENYLDKEVGIPVRLCLYNILLDYPEIVKPLFSHNGPWYANLYLFFAFSKIEKIMRRFMNINDKTSIVSQQRLTAAIDRLNEHYKNNEFLVGHSFSRADLSAASLAAPLTMQKQYGLDWPTKLPKKLEELMAEFEGKLDWVDRIYTEYR
jgi:glutathione S-transferase